MAALTMGCSDVSTQNVPPSSAPLQTSSSVVALGPPTTAVSPDVSSGQPGSAVASTIPTAKSAPAPRGDGRLRLVVVELGSEDPTASQYVIVGNDGTGAVDLHCWKIRSATTGTTTVVTSGSAQPAAGVRLLVPFGAFRVADSLTLVAPDGAASDTTPALDDSAHDEQVWFRAGEEWRFGRPNLSLSVSDAKTSGSTSGC